MTTATMVTTVVAMVMVAAACIGIKTQLASQESIHRFIGLPCYAAHYHNAGFCQSHSGSATDTATNQKVYPLLGQQTCQGAMAAAIGIDYPFLQNFSGLNLIDLKLRTMAKMLVDSLIFVSYRNFHRNAPFYFISRQTNSV